MKDEHLWRMLPFYIVTSSVISRSFESYVADDNWRACALCSHSKQKQKNIISLSWWRSSHLLFQLVNFNDITGSMTNSKYGIDTFFFSLKLTLERSRVNSANFQWRSSHPNYKLICILEWRHPHLSRWNPQPPFFVVTHFFTRFINDLIANVAINRGDIRIKSIQHD